MSWRFRPLSLVAVVLTGVSALWPQHARADDCGLLGGALSGGECQIASAQTKSGTFKLGETLHILGNGSILVPTAPGGNTLTLSIEGDFLMDIPTVAGGSVISGDVTTSQATGAAIGITTMGGNIVLHGNGTAGAKISASQLGHANKGSRAGSITLTANDRSVTIENGAALAATAVLPAGEIKVSAPRGSIDIEGAVLSESTLSGSGNSLGGGPITVSAGCNLTVGDTGLVSSKGTDPGADLVHLQGGCSVKILGLVQSTGAGHGVPKPPNRCASANRPDKPSNATACVEIWAGDSLTIDRTTTHLGEVNADTGGPGGASGTSWIDLFSRGDITIAGTAAGTYTVRANGNAVTNDDGGVVTVRTRDGQILTSGLALQANAPGNGGAGGTLAVEAGGPSGSGNVALGTASLQARGATKGGHPAGGRIGARAFSGSVLGDAGGELNASGGPGNGLVVLQGCNVPGPAVSYQGAATPAATTLPPSCGGAPTFAAYVALPDCLCGCFCIVSLSVEGGVLTIDGQNLNEVTRVELNTTCETGAGTAIPRTSFLTQTDTRITLTLPAGSSGKRAILVNAATGSSSCSTQVLP
jgi:hypothetical protein